MMSLMGGDDAFYYDVVGGDDDDGGRGALNWGTCKCLAVWVHAPLFQPNSPKICQNIYFSTLGQPLSRYCVRLFAIGL